MHDLCTHRQQIGAQVMSADFHLKCPTSLVYQTVIRNEGTTLEVQDDSDLSSYLLSVIYIMNFTWPESIGSTGPEHCRVRDIGKQRAR